MGLTGGGTMAHTATGQTGGTSTELSQRGCISPSTQRQTEAALDSAVSSDAKTTVNNRRTARSQRQPFAILIFYGVWSARRAALPRQMPIVRSKMRRLEKARSFRQIGQLRAKTSSVTLPNLPFASRRLHSYPARIGNGLFDTATAEAAWTNSIVAAMFRKDPYCWRPPRVG